jgi:hypothetical protein
MRTLSALLLSALFVSTDAATLAPRKTSLDKSLALRGGLDKSNILLANAAGLTAFGTEFGLAWLGSKWASTRYWDDASPTAAWQQMSEAFSVALLMFAYQTYDTAKNGDDAAKDKLGKLLSFGWIGWSLMHVKWWNEGSLISSGKLMGQVGGGIPCALLALLNIKGFLLK